MKKLLLSALAALASLPMAAQIEFRDMSMSEAQETAKQENKLIFMDCYTSWCGPCKRLAKEVFVLPEVGEYMNPRFVALKVDMEKGEGVTLGDKYDVNAYPTMLVLDTEGNVVWRYAGYMEGDNLINAIEKGVKGNEMNEMKKKYDAGERSAEFIADYLGKLEEAAMSSTIAAVTDDFLNGKADEVISNDATFAIFRRYVKPESTLFQEVYKRKSELMEKRGNNVLWMMNRKWDEAGRRCLTREGKELNGYNKEKLEQYHAALKDCNVPEADCLYGKYLAEGAVAAGEYSEAVRGLQLYSTYSRLLSEEDYFCLASRKLMPNLAKGSKERKILHKLVAKRLKVLTGYEDTSGRTMTIAGERMPMAEYFRRTYEELTKAEK